MVRWVVGVTSVKHSRTNGVEGVVHEEGHGQRGDLRKGLSVLRFNIEGGETCRLDYLINVLIGPKSSWYIVLLLAKSELSVRFRCVYDR